MTAKRVYHRLLFAFDTPAGLTLLIDDYEMIPEQNLYIRLDFEGTNKSSSKGIAIFIMI